MSSTSLPVKRRKYLFHIVALSLILVASCEQPFDATIPAKQQLIVFSVLSTDRDMQFVRVQSSYAPPGGDPRSDTSSHDVTDAVVYLKNSLSTFQLSDTVLPRPDTSRYKSPVRAYVLPDYVLNNGESYEVEVQSPTLGVASGSVDVPEQADLSIDALTFNVLRIPYNFSDATPIFISTPMTNTTKGYIFRMYLYYDVLKENEWVEERVEIPIGSLRGEGFSLDNVRYGELTLSRGPGTLLVRYSNGFYLNVIKELTTKKYATNRITYKWVVFSILQLEENLYRYYSSVHEYQDPLSIRLDDAIYSNLQGGLGMLGAYTLDSLLYVLPANFDGNR